MAASPTQVLRVGAGSTEVVRIGAVSTDTPRESTAVASRIPNYDGFDVDFNDIKDFFITTSYYRIDSNDIIPGINRFYVNLRKDVIVILPDIQLPDSVIEIINQGYYTVSVYKNS